MGEDERTGGTPMNAMLYRLFLIGVFCSAPSALAQWKEAFQKTLAKIDAEYPGQFGVHVRHLQHGDIFSFRADEKWYLASGIKLLVAIEVFRQIDEGKLTLTTMLPVEQEDLVDGPGQTSATPLGSRHSVLHLLEQMITVSDNTATDILIRKTGIKNINAWAKHHGFERITTLAQVRRLIYGQIYPTAKKLTGADLVRIGGARGDREKIEILNEILGATPGEAKLDSLEGAYIAYYASGVNSATLKTFSRVLAKISAGEVLKPESTKTLLEIMERTQTGEKRIKHGLPEDVVFAHKTGTQRKRSCDFGFVRRDGVNLAVVSVCTRGLATPDAEKVMTKIGRALGKSGAFTAKVASDG